MNTSAATFSGAGEAEWERLSRHLQWLEGFGLVFLFVSHAGLCAEVHRRLVDLCQLRAAPLQSFRPDAPDTLVEQAVALARRPDPVYLHGNSPLWLQANPPGSEWDGAREQLLRRLNERRELLRSSLQRPLLLVLPENFLAQAAHLAPDLWSIRQTAAVFGPDCLADAPIPPVVLPGDSPARPATAMDESLWQEWQRLRDSEPSRELLQVGWQACEAALNTRHLDLAGTIADAVLGSARHLAAAGPGTPETVRDLSISLERVGDMARARGRWDEAAAALREAQTGWARLSAAFPDHEEFREQAARLAEVLKTLGDSPAKSNPDAEPD